MLLNLKRLIRHVKCFLLLFENFLISNFNQNAILKKEIYY
ncbi:hypothetical protein Lpl7_1677 [Lacticaseibacillus paracasei subsp. tolerans Lpl7]|nr:hypothetical protein Lpp230_1692 [Lacticaseibacillus paracasei subsp. paracasei Lpp230]EPC14363.1 hypothetical protein Lpl7_1677 [Lacticaseibacillus paracasei subsp. tolerans Lpl7]